MFLIVEKLFIIINKILYMKYIEILDNLEILVARKCNIPGYIDFGMMSEDGMLFRFCN